MCKSLEMIRKSVDALAKLVGEDSFCVRLLVHAISQWYSNDTIKQKWLISAVPSKCYMISINNTGRCQTLKQRTSYNYIHHSSNNFFQQTNLP